MVNDRLLIDFPADTYYHIMAYGLNINHIDSVIVTHAHEDHLYPLEFGNRREFFAYLPDDVSPVFTIYGSRKVGDAVKGAIASAPGRLAFEELLPFESYVIAGHSVTPLTADHDPSSGPYIYLIGDGERLLLYAHDTGYFTDETWDYLGKMRRRISAASLDCTGGLGAQYRNGHMGTEACSETKRRLCEMGIMADDAVFCLNHFSHNGRSIYDDIVGPASDMGFEVSYDGMVLEF